MQTRHPPPPRPATGRFAVRRSNPLAEPDHAAPEPSFAPVDQAITIGDIPDAVFATNLENRVTHWADSAAAMFGYTAAEAIGRPFGDLLPFRMRRGADERDLLAAIAAGRTWRGEGTVRLRDGLELWIESTVKPRVVEGRIVGSVSVSRDITAAIAAEQALTAEERFVSGVLDVAASLVLVLAPDGAVVRFNTACERLSGYRAEEVIGRPLWDLLIPPAEREGVMAAFVDLRAGAFPNEHENHWRCRDGSLPLIHWANTCLTDERGRVSHVIGTGTDVTEQRRAQQSIAERARLLAALSDFGQATSAILQPDLLVPAIMGALERIFPGDVMTLTTLDRATNRYRLRASRGLDATLLGREVELGDGPAGRAMAARAFVGPVTLGRDQYWSAARRLIAAETLVSVTVPLVRDDRVLGAISIGRANLDRPFSDVECEVMRLLGSQAALALANADLHQEVSELAIHDGLTGLYNRRHFDAALDLVIARWRRRRGTTSVAAIMLDLDHFGRFNNEHGHQAGDAVLRSFAGLLRKRLRSSDLVARYGGEEFVVIMEESGLSDAIRVAEQIRAGLERRLIVGPLGEPLHARVSAGCAEISPAEPTKEALLRAADVALAMAKRSGRNRVVAA